MCKHGIQFLNIRTIAVVPFVPSRTNLQSRLIFLSFLQMCVCSIKCGSLQCNHAPLYLRSTNVNVIFMPCIMESRSRCAVPSTLLVDWLAIRSLLK